MKRLLKVAIVVARLLLLDLITFYRLAHIHIDTDVDRYLDLVGA